MCDHRFWTGKPHWQFSSALQWHNSSGKIEKRKKTSTIERTRHVWEANKQHDQNQERHSCAYSFLRWHHSIVSMNFIDVTEFDIRFGEEGTSGFSTLKIPAFSNKLSTFLEDHQWSNLCGIMKRAKWEVKSLFRTHVIPEYFAVMASCYTSFKRKHFFFLSLVWPGWMICCLFFCSHLFYTVCISVQHHDDLSWQVELLQPPKLHWFYF